MTAAVRQLRAPPSARTIIDAMGDDSLFGLWFPGPSWNNWRTVLKAIFGLPMNEVERAFFCSIADRAPPAQRVRECWLIAGRRAGKDSIVSLIAAYVAALFEPRGLRRGERALVMCLACDRDQAKIVHGYIRSYFADIPPLRAMVMRETVTGVELDNGVDIAIATNTFRSVRGRSLLCAILDEAAFYRDENSSNPDEEIYRALRPGLATVPGSIMIGLSTPHRKAGLLYRKFCDHYGRDGDVLVVRAPSLTLNPTIDPREIERDLEEDPTLARAEWLCEWRDDVSGWATCESIEAAVERGVTVRRPLPGVFYRSFVDASGGVRDSFSAAVAHMDGDVAVLDCLLEIRAPFNPDSATAQVAGMLRSYRCRSTEGDKYAAEWVIDAFRRHGVTYEQSERDRSAIYADMLPLLTTGRTKLLDNRRLVSQLASLERTALPAGRDKINHPKNGADDCANAAAGALVRAAGRRQPLHISKGAMERARQKPSRWPSSRRAQWFF